jgi:hypothetical protein
VKVCSVIGCEGKVRSSGLCRSHYSRKLKFGDPMAGRTPNGLPMRWLKAHVNHASDECLMWPFGKTAGYGTIGYAGQRGFLASRLMCILAHGEPPEKGQQAAHSCGRGVEGCVNPRHLRWKTHMENVLEREEHRRTGVIRVHRRDSIEPIARQAAMTLQDAGFSAAHIARMTGIPFLAVADLVGVRS